MTRGKLLVVVVVVLCAGYATGFVTRPFIMPVVNHQKTAAPALPNPKSSEARSIQYFAANPEEARRVIAGCREGNVRGDECANADTAVIAAESKDRFRRFRGER